MDKYMNNIIRGDNIKFMSKHLPDRSIDVIFADPSYNLCLQKIMEQENES